MTLKPIFKLNSAFEGSRGAKAPRMIAQVRMTLSLERELLTKGKDAVLPSSIRADLLAVDAMDDFVWTLDPLQLVSLNAKIALKRCCGNDVRFIPVRFARAPRDLPAYWLVHPQRMIDCYDRERSTIGPSFNDQGFTFTRFRIDRTAVPKSTKLWRVKYRTEILVTDSVRSELLTQSLKGCQFTKA